MLPVAAPCRHYLHSGPLEGGPMSYRLEMFSQKQIFNDIFIIKQDTLILLLTCHEIGVEKMAGRVLFSHGIQESKLIDEPTSECFRVWIDHNICKSFHVKNSDMDIKSEWYAYIFYKSIFNWKILFVFDRSLVTTSQSELWISKKCAKVSYYGSINDFSWSADKIGLIIFEIQHKLTGPLHGKNTPGHETEWTSTSDLSFSAFWVILVKNL